MGCINSFPPLGLKSATSPTHCEWQSTHCHLQSFDDFCCIFQMTLVVQSSVCVLVFQQLLYFLLTASHKSGHISYSRLIYSSYLYWFTKASVLYTILLCFNCSISYGEVCFQNFILNHILCTLQIK